jgi:hypothetical protein
VAVGQFVGQQAAGEADLAVQRGQGVLLRLGVLAVIPLVRDQRLLLYVTNCRRSSIRLARRKIANGRELRLVESPARVTGEVSR